MTDSFTSDGISAITNKIYGIVNLQNTVNIPSDTLSTVAGYFSPFVAPYTGESVSGGFSIYDTNGHSYYISSPAVYNISSFTSFNNFVDITNLSPINSGSNLG